MHFTHVGASNNPRSCGLAQRRVRQRVGFTGTAKSPMPPVVIQEQIGAGGMGIVYRAPNCTFPGGGSRNQFEPRSCILGQEGQRVPFAGYLMP